MRGLVLALVAALMTLSACGSGEPVTRYGPDGKPLPRVYRISRGDAAKIQYRMLDSVNVLRNARGLAPLELDARLNAAAETHSRDMSVQNRPWAFGSGGQSPYILATQVGYQGSLQGLLVSESYETELETLAGWMEEADKSAIILDPAATEMGFAYFQEPNGKIWWTIITGRSQPALAGL
ncbi:Putative transmembrane protein [Rhodovulum sp. P5]|uniref:CAP domain-containing protein n=1 Tax=Rhodovulum sp. P5 TaxID=1564506 RepID=UPI0009C2AB0C|nr:CAP domain-containing protein [Rhodovulum sp. P5]ARE40645.1 Putative transmembrane protein [Rhodovulum sp. P5]